MPYLTRPVMGEYSKLLPASDNFVVQDLHWLPASEGKVILQTMRNHDQYNTTIYGLDDRCRGVKGGRRVAFCRPDDITAAGFAGGDRVDLASEWKLADGSVEERRAEDFRLVPCSTPRAVTRPPTTAGTNPLIPLDHTARRSNTPVFEAVTIRLEGR